MNDLNQFYPVNQFELCLCEIYHPLHHGSDDSIILDKCLGHYITIYTHNPRGPEYLSNNESDDEEDDLCNDEYWEMNEIVRLYTRTYKAMPANKLNHPFIRNYQKIMKSPTYIQPEIVEQYFLDVKICGNSYPVELAIKKTIWIRIIQRAWKRVYAERHRISQMIENNPSLLFKRQQDVKFTIRMPSLYGMLRGLRL